MGAKSFIEKKLTEHNLSAKCAQFFLGQWRMTGLDNEDKFVVAENRQVKIIEKKGKIKWLYGTCLQAI